MIKEIQTKNGQTKSAEASTMPKSPKMASDDGCMLTDSNCNAVKNQMCKARGLANIPIVEANLLVQMVGSVISIYPPVGDEISFIPYAELLKPYLFAARAKLLLTTSARRVPLIQLLKLATFRMAAQDRWSLAYFGHVVIKNGIKVARSITWDTSQFSDP